MRIRNAESLRFDCGICLHAHQILPEPPGRPKETIVLMNHLPPPRAHPALFPQFSMRD